MRAGTSSARITHHEGGGEVLAEAQLAVEPELVDRVARRRRRAPACRCSRRCAGARSTACTSARASAWRQRGSRRSSAAQCQRARVVAGRQLAGSRAGASAGCARAVAEARPGLRPGSAAGRSPGASVCHCRSPRQRSASLDARRRVGAVGRQLEQRQQGQPAAAPASSRSAPARRSSCRSRAAAGAARRAAGLQRRPLAAVEARQHRAAEVQSPRAAARAPSKRTRKAMLSSSASSATPPMLHACPTGRLRPLGVAAAGPTAAPMRGNSRNSTTISGAPSSASARRPARRLRAAAAGPPACGPVDQRRQQAPAADTSMAAAVSSDCE